MPTRSSHHHSRAPSSAPPLVPPQPIFVVSSDLRPHFPAPHRRSSSLSPRALQNQVHVIARALISCVLLLLSPPPPAQVIYQAKIKCKQKIFIFPLSHWKSVLLNQRTMGWLYMLHLHPTHAVAVSVQRHRPVPWRATVSASSWRKNVFTVHHQNPCDRHFLHARSGQAAASLAGLSSCAAMRSSSRGKTH